MSTSHNPKLPRLCCRQIHLEKLRAPLPRQASSRKRLAAGSTRHLKHGASAVAQAAQASQDERRAEQEDAFRQKALEELEAVEHWSRCPTKTNVRYIYIKNNM